MGHNMVTSCDKKIKDLMEENGRLCAANRALVKTLESLNGQLVVLLGKLEEIEQNIKGHDNGSEID